MMNTMLYYTMQNFVISILANNNGATNLIVESKLGQSTRPTKIF